jgi:superfamily I DNA and/or RNA helicase
VKQYVNWLLKNGYEQKDIGVITPYRRQARLIRDKLKAIIKPDEVKPLKSPGVHNRMSNNL